MSARSNQRAVLGLLPLAGLACFVLIPFTRLRLAEAIILLAALVVVRAGMVFAAGRDQLDSGCAPGRWRIALAIQPVAALALVASFTLETGALAAALAAPWLAFTFLVALLGVLRLCERGRVRPLSELSIDVGLVYLAVGGMWLEASRLGVVFMGFGEPIVLLTAAHFHYAGFALPILAGLATRSLAGSPRWRALGEVCCAGVISGVVFVAIGINLSRSEVLWFEPLAALWLAVSAMGVAALQLRVAFESGVRASGRALLSASSVSLLIAMLLALGYASGQAFGWRGITVPVMIHSHGVLNAIGFVLPALFFWLAREETPDALRGLRLHVSCLDGSANRLRDALVGAAEIERERRPGDREIEVVELVALEEPGAPVPCGPFERVARAIERFDIFPPSALEALGRAGPVALGEVVVSRASVVPLVSVGLAARVTELFGSDEDGDVEVRGFTYATLAGHPFVGEETFLVQKDRASGEVRAIIRSWSRAAPPLVRIVGPWVRFKQRRALRGAFARLAAIARGGSTEAAVDVRLPGLQRAGK